jgi:cytochrome P450
LNGTGDINIPSINIPSFVEQVIAANPAPTMIPRVTATAVNVGGVALPVGATVGLFLGGDSSLVSTDPNGDQRAESLLPTGNNEGKVRSHLSFGAGVHRCLGMHLARVGLTTLVEELVTRWETT